jgi:hypothetical protein
VEFFNTKKENNKRQFFARIGKKAIVIDKHILGELFKISTKWLKEEKSIDEIKTKKMLENIAMLHAYVNNE